MRTTSAPMSASIMAQKGPGPMPAISITFVPESGPVTRSLLARFVSTGRMQSGATKGRMIA